MRRCSATSRACSATSPNGTASRSASRSGSSISRPSAAAPASIWRICSCGPRIAARGIGKALMVASRAQRCVAERLGALRVVGARLERAVDRFLQVARRRCCSTSGPICRVSGDALARLGRAERRSVMRDRPRRRGRRERRDRPRRRDAVAAQVRHAAFPRADHGQAGGDGAQDLCCRSDQAAARPHQHRGDARPDFAAPGVLVAPSLEAALEAARGDALRRGSGRIMVIGGAEIYAQAMPRADRLEITHVHASPEGDTRLPADRPGGWRESARASHPAGPDDDGAAYDLSSRYRRTKRRRTPSGVNANSATLGRTARRVESAQGVSHITPPGSARNCRHGPRPGEIIDAVE